MAESVRRRRSPSKIELLRERIRHAALELFLRKGFARTGVREIAAGAEVSVGTIFNYFATKEDILFAIISEMQKGVAIPLQIAASQYRTRALVMGEDPEDALLALLDEYARAVHKWRRHLLLGYQEARSLTPDQLRQILDGERRMRDLLADLIQIGVERGKFTPGDLRFRAHSIQVLLQSWAARPWALDGVELGTFAQMAERAILSMLHAPEGSRVPLPRPRGAGARTGRRRGGKPATADARRSD